MPHQCKGALEKRAIVNTDRATAKLPAIQHNVVLLCKRPRGGIALAALGKITRRRGEQVLIASRNGEAGPIRLTPIDYAGLSEAQLECGDEGAVSPSDGRASLAYEAPPADTNTVDPWEQRGSQAEER